VLALGPGHRGLARAFNPRPVTSPGFSGQGWPAGFLDFFLFFKRISNETDLNDDLPTPTFLVTITWDESPSRQISQETYLRNKKIMVITP
jgi:hypothetical protein